MKIGTVERSGEQLVAVGTDDEQVLILADIMDDAPATVMQVIDGKQAIIEKIATAIKGKSGQASDSFKWLPPYLGQGRLYA